MNIHAQRFGSLLRQIFQPPGSDTFGLTPDIFPVAPLVHPDRSEYSRPRGEHLFEGTLTQAAGVGVASNWFISSSPGMITVIEQLEITAGAATIPLLLGLSIAPSGVVFAAQSFSIDSRNIPRGKWAAGAETFGRRAVLTAVNTSAAPPGGTSLRQFWSGPTLQTNVLSCRYVLVQPGADLGTFPQLALFVSTNTGLNTALTVNVRGWERKYQDSELSDWT